MPSPGPKEHLVATLRVEHPPTDGSIVAAVVGAAAPELGLGAAEGVELARAAGAVARAIYARGFDDPADAAVEVTLLRVGHQAMVRIDDRGLPFNAAAEDALDAEIIEGAIRDGWLDAMTHEARGREGNRTVLVRHIDAGADLRDEPDRRGDPPIASGEAAAPIGADVAIETRLAEPTDAEAICRLTWRTYGYSYQHDEYYQPDRLAAMITSGLQTSFIAVTPDGEVVGHSAVLLEEEGDVIVEAGRAMVDPRFRGHHLMGTARERREQWMREHGVLALEGAAVTAHTRSQTDRPVTSVQLAFLPAIEFRAIEGSEATHREAVVGGIFPVAPIPAQQVTLPQRDAAIIAEIYRRNELERETAEGRPAPASGSASQVALQLRGDLGHAVVTCSEIGADLRAEIHHRVAAAERAGMDVVYADIPLDQPDVSWAADVLADEGFIFSGVLPLARRGIDVVRYQRLGATAVDPAEIHLKHPFSRELLDYVLAQRREVEGAWIDATTTRGGD